MSASQFQQIAGGASELGGLVTDLFGGFIYKPIQAKKNRRLQEKMFNNQMALEKDKFNLERMLSMPAYEQQMADLEWKKNFRNAWLRKVKNG